MKRDKELKQAIINWLFDHANKWQRVNECTEAFRAYIYDDKGNYLIGGKETSEFIRKADNLIFD